MCICLKVAIYNMYCKGLRGWVIKGIYLPGAPPTPNEQCWEQEWKVTHLEVTHLELISTTREKQFIQ